ncbi:MAG: translocation/assembly module TamB domain-containing protein, partial [Chitinophagaceae bacterium]
RSKMRLIAKERSGFEVKSMTADVKMTPQGMAFSNLEILTNRSTIRNFYSMSYNDFSDFGDYISRIQMAAVFDDSYIDSDDIAFFAPKLASWKKKISLKGKVRGTVDDLVGRDMLVSAGNSTLLNGDISMTGLPDINRTFIDFKANDFRTTYSDAVTIVPAIQKVTSPDLRKLQYVNFKGNFTGFLRDFVTFGTIQTNLGTLVSDLNMKLPPGQEPVYSGNISTDNFRLGYFLDDKTLGDVALKAVIKGRGFSDKARMVNFDGTISYADINGYRYHNIVVDGLLDKKMFEGTASIKDDNADLRLNGIIDFNKKTPRFNLQADVAKALLYKLGLTSDSLSFSGKAHLDFTSDNIDNFLGTARVTEAELKKGEQRLSFDSLVVTAGYEGGVKKLSVGSNELNGTITGNFNLNELPSVATYFLHKYYPAYVKAPKRLPKDQAFTFNIDAYYVDEYLQLVNPHLSGFNGTKLKGSLDMLQHKLEVVADVPQFRYRGHNFDKVLVRATGNEDSLLLNGEASNIRINDSLSIPHAAFRIRSHNDSSNVSVLTGASQAVEKADLHALVLTYNDGVKIEFEPSVFTINSKTWTIGDNGELVLRSSTPASALLVLSEGQEQILVQTQPSKSGKGNDITVKLTDVNLGDFSPYFMPKNRLEGLLSGNILVEDPTGKMKITSDDIQTKFLRLDNDSLGEVRASVAYDGELKQLKVKGNTLNQENYLGFDANIFFDKDKARNNLIALKAKNFQISVLERFLGNLFSDMQGYLTGDVNISGEFDELSVTGKGRLRNAGLKVNFTQCFYKILDTDINLTPYEINLDGLILIDTVTKNPIYLVGGIEHQSFKNMFYNLDITTRKPGTKDEDNNRPVQLLNTTYKDNKQFYGNVKGTGSMTLAGPQSDMYMKIDAVASEKDSSYVTIPPSSSRESGIADFLVERKYGREMEASDVKSNTNIIYDVDLTINKTPVPMVSVRVILDELTGDEIKGKGNGSLNIKSGTTEPLSLRGRFDIEEGSYLFTFQSFFKKPFELKKDAQNYIEWNGDPYDANIKFDAIYRAERVSFAPLADLLQTKSARGDVYVVASLSDKLFKPAIAFSLDFPTTSVAVTDPELALIIQQLLKNPNEVNRQVTYLIVFNSFAPSDLTGTSTNYSVTELGLTTISGILLNVISDQINKILGNLLKSDKYNISLNTSIYNRNVISNGSKLELGSNINFTIGRSFFNNRFIISTGLGFDAPLQTSSTQQAFSQQLLPDVVLEWLINPSGSIRASFFYRENTDYLTTATSGGPGKARRIGASLSYRKDFDRLGDIFKGKKKKQKPLKPAQPAADDKKTVEVKKEGNE